MQLANDQRNGIFKQVLLNLLHLGAHAISGLGAGGVWHPTTAQAGRYHNEAFAETAQSFA